MSIIDYLYKGAAPGERVATQKAVQNMPYGQIGKNILAEGGFGTGSNNRGYDPNFKGKGALPSNTALQKYVTGPYNYIKGGVSSIFGGNAAGNIGGGTPAQRQLFEKVASSPFSKTMGTAAKTALSASMTAGPTGAYAMYQMNKPSTPAGYDYVRDYDMGSITGAMDETAGLDYENFSKGMMAADKNYTGVTSATQNQTPYNYNEVDKFTNDEQGPIVDQEMQEYFNTLPEEEKEGFGKFLSNAGVNIGNFARDKAMPALKDAAGRTIASQAGSGAGYMLAGPYGALAGGILGAFKGGNLFNAPYRGATQGGGGYTIDQLNKQNARGGYYTDTARGQRQQANRIENMLNRAADGKSYSRKNLESLSGLSGSNLDRTITDKKTAAPGHIGNENTTGTGGGKSIVCTAMYQTTGLQDWAKAMKVWYIYQKRHLSDAHQEGYHLLFKPFVKGMHKNKIIRAVGAHVAKHRTQELKHILFNSKSDTLGKIYNKILEPICYIVGKIKFIFKKK
jgi:hypothetical protein